MAVSTGGGARITLTPDDCEAILRECRSVTTAAPSVDCRMQIIYGNRNWVPRNILGTTPAFLTVRNWTDLDAGEAFTDNDVRGAACVCLMGQTPAHELFDTESPVGKFVRIKNVRLKVVGVLAAKGASVMGFDQDDFLVVPWTTVKYRLSSVRQIAIPVLPDSASLQVNSLTQLYPSQQLQCYPLQSAAQLVDTPHMLRFADLDDIWITAATPESVPVVMGEIAEVLRERHKISEDKEDDFRIRDPAEFSAAFAKTAQMLTNLLMSVALISLLVGGVGVMNIMLVSVTERTREIGLRMAVGARASDIRRQFLTEAVAQCLVGGVAGIALGRGASSAVATFLNWPVRPSLAAVLAAVIVSTAVGVVFGYYHALKASRLYPNEALRYE